MEFALAAIAGVLAVALVVVLLRRRPEDTSALRGKVDEVAATQASLKDNLNRLEVALAGVQTRVSDATGRVETSLLKDLAGVRETLARMNSDLDASRRLEQELQESTRLIEAVVAGGRNRGRAGENILAEALKKFPPQIVETDFRVNGKPVEYALVLADGKRIPVDSKWTQPELLARLDETKDPAEREKIVRQLRDVVLAKAREVTKYINPEHTVLWGIAAVPDPVFDACRDVHLDAFQSRVIVMPYSLTVIYLLSLYQLHLQYCRSVDTEKLEGYLSQVGDSLNRLDNELDNKLARGATMVQNAFQECKRLVADLRAATAGIKVIPAGTQTPLASQGNKDMAS